MTEFHFLRPLWLWLLPVALLLLVIWYRRRGQVGNWASVVAPALLPYVVSRDVGVGRLRRWVTIAGGVALLLTVLALSGPTWERLPTPVLRSTEALVVVLDLSRSMDATDIEPTRLARARLKILDLLQRRPNGQTALVVFSAHAFTVTPLTNDAATVAALVNSLATDIMPSQGSYPDTGVEKALQLLSQAGVGDGEILLITDAGVDPRLEKIAAKLASAGHRLHVLGVGTAAGAPIPRGNGGFLTNPQGEVVVPRLDTRALRRVAGLGGGSYATLSADDSDIAALLDAATAVGAAAEDGDQQNMETVLWHDRGPYLVLLLLPMMAYAFRKGLIAALFVALLLPPVPANALSWDELWLSPDQRAARALATGDEASAAALFADERWRAAALYRTGEFSASADALKGLDGPEDLYNVGNALARSGDLNGALQAYERAIELDPEHEDAIFNRDLLLEQMPPPQQQQGEQGQEGEQGEENETDSEDSAGGESQPEEGEGEQQQEQETSADDSQQPGEEGEQPEQQQAGAEESLDEWASEQAADQWLRRIPDDPGGLLRRKFRYQYQRFGKDQDGNSVWPGNEEEPY